MDYAALLGSLSIIVVFVFGVLTPDLVIKNIQYMWSPSSLIIVLFGTLAATLASYPLDTFFGLGRSLKRIYLSKSIQFIETLVIIVDVAKVARKNVLAIEDSLPSIENEYLRNGLRLVVDRVDRELIMDIMSSQLKYIDKQKQLDQQVIKQMSSLAPSFGMIGTLIGLILMLQDLSDPSKIGPNMAIALITTLYGSLLSNGVFVPWHNVLDVARTNEMVLFEMVRDGVLFIEKNERAEFIEHRFSRQYYTVLFLIYPPLLSP
jgi:chemotaxis protein MotA